MSCKDCLHFIVCERANFIFDDIEKQEQCKYRKNKADFVEVVRCIECKYWVNKNGGYCRASNALAMVNNENNDFCSYGKRMIKE